jgi:catechol 2,3-dioxygenase-like lactoylglutathione lyase family enzyme
MNCKILPAVLLTVLGALLFAGCSTDTEPAAAHRNRIRFEHIALNVDDSIKVAEWYRDNLGMTIVREAKPPGSKRFVADPGRNMMFEFYRSRSAPVPDYASMNNHQLHIAFMVDDVKAVCDKLIAAGGQLDGEVPTTREGDVIAIVGDPWGIPIELLTRALPMLSHD